MTTLSPDLSLNPSRDMLKKEVRDELKNSDKLVVLDPETDKAGIYGKSRPEFHAAFKTILMSMVECNDQLKLKDLFIDGTLTREEEQKFGNVGVFRQKIGSMELVLNWTSQGQGDIPPRHVLVMWADEFCGILGPYENIRHCWSCGLRGWRDKGKTVAWVHPDRPCPRCDRLDWVARIITQADVIRSCAEWMATATGNDYYEERLGRLSIDESNIQRKQAKKGTT